MSVRPKTPQLPDVPPGLAALSSAAAAALQNQEKSSAIDLQNAATLGQHKEPTVIPQEASVGLSLLKDGDNGGGSLSSMDEHNMAAGRAYTTSPPSVSRDESEIVREKISFTCTYEQKHLIGQFCFHCRAMEMPWGDQHPIALDTSGNKIIIAPQGSLLEGVKNLTEPYEIAQLALIIEFRIIQQNLDSIPGLVESLRFFRNLHDVAHRIANLAQELETLADEDERERVPRWFNILHELLKQPTLTRDQYFARATEKWNLQPINGAIHKAKSPAPIIPSFQLLSRAFTGTPVMLNREEAIANDAQTHSEAQVEELINHLDRNESRGPGYVQFTLDFVGWLREGAHGTGRGAPQWGPRYVQEYHDLRHSRTVVARRSSRNDASRFTGRLDFLCGRNSAPTTPVRSEEEPDVEVYDSNESEEDEQWNFRRIPEKKKNTPGRANVKWRFVEGTDIENAVLGQPDPSKFYFTRYNVDNPMEVDLRQFPGIAGFDWNDPKDIKKLNKARAQNRKRTHGNIAETRVPWTQMEKACLVEEVEEAINAGFNRKTIEWDDIAARLKSRFEGVLQKKGSKLAPGVEREPKNGQKDKSKYIPFLWMIFVISLGSALGAQFLGRNFRVVITNSLPV